MVQRVPDCTTDWCLWGAYKLGKRYLLGEALGQNEVGQIRHYDGPSDHINNRFVSQTWTKTSIDLSCMSLVVVVVVVVVVLLLRLLDIYLAIVVFKVMTQ